MEETKLQSAFNTFWVSRAIAAVSSTSAPVVFTLAILHIADHRTLSAALSAQVFGQVSALLISGPIFDRVKSRKTFLILCQAATGATWLAITANLLWASPEYLIWLGAILGVLSGLNGPATQSVIRALVQDSEIKAKVANLRITLNSIAIASPALAGLALGLVPAWTVTILLCLCHVFSALQLTRLPNLPREAPAEQANLQGPREPIWKLLTAPWFLIPVLFTALINIAWAGFFQLRGPIILASNTNLSALGWGIISASLAAGLVLGGFYYKRQEFKNPTVTPILFTAPKALPVVMLFLWPAIIPLAISNFIAGFLLEAFAVNFYTQVQLKMPDRSIGTALSADTFIGLFLLPAGYSIASSPLVTEHPEPAQVIAAASILIFAVAGWALLRSRLKPSRGSRL